MLRKVTSLLVTTMALSLLAIVGELTILNLARAPARSVAGARPRAPGRQAHRVGADVPAVSGSLRPPSRVGPVEWSEYAGPAAPQGLARRTDLRREPDLGRPIQRGEYARRTSPNRTGSIPGGTTAGAPGKAPIFLLGATMLAAALSVARRDVEMPGETPARSERLRPGTSTGTRQPTLRIQLPAARPVRRKPALRDQIAEWEQVRLVPT